MIFSCHYESAKGGRLTGHPSLNHKHGMNMNETPEYILHISKGIKLQKFRKDLTGQVFGKLTVLCYAKWQRWLCKCECGGLAVVRFGDLGKGNTVSCGCEFRRLSAKRKTSHAKSYSSEYQTWANIKYRCLNPNSANWKNYGGIGISVSNDWMIFENFFRDMGAKPFPRATIERINFRGNYCKENCRWATYKEQGNNKSTNRIIEFNGKRMNVKQWEEELGFPRNMLNNRLNVLGWSETEALSAPPMKCGRRKA